MHPLVSFLWAGILVIGGYFLYADLTHKYWMRRMRQSIASLRPMLEKVRLGTVGYMRMLESVVRGRLDTIEKKTEVISELVDKYPIATKIADEDLDKAGDDYSVALDRMHETVVQCVDIIAMIDGAEVSAPFDFDTWFDILQKVKSSKVYDYVTREEAAI